MARKRIGRVVKQCLHCGGSFAVVPSNLTKKYCSRRCSGLANSTQYVSKECLVCSKELKVIESVDTPKLTCSKICEREYTIKSKEKKYGTYRDNIIASNQSCSTEIKERFNVIMSEIIRLTNENRFDTPEHIEACRQLRVLDYDDCVERNIGNPRR